MQKQRRRFKFGKKAEQATHPFEHKFILDKQSRSFACDYALFDLLLCFAWIAKPDFYNYMTAINYNYSPLTTTQMLQ